MELKARTAAGARLPWLLLAGALALAVLLLSIPLRAPIGAMYWDTYTYYDAAQRILSGQTPAVDFFTPGGPLGYAVAALWIWLFPNGQPSLLLHWSTMTMTLPLMALVLWGLPAGRHGLGLWLTLPFLLFSLLPFNGKEFYPFPGSDGFAYYNRQVCLILFPLVAGLIFVRDRRLLVALVTLAMLALFFVKITGFLAGGLICAFALLAGRIGLRDAAIAAALFAVTLGVAEFALGGVISGYLADILLLARMNDDTLAPRMLQSLSINFGVAGALGLLSLTLIAADRDGLKAACRELARERSFAALAKLADRPAFWIAAITVAGILFETQNTGSQAMIFVWPVLLWALIGLPAWLGKPKTAIAVAALAGAAYLPLVVTIVERAARAYIGAVSSLPLQHANLKTLGAVVARPVTLARADVMDAIYERRRQTFEEIAAHDALPTFTFYSDFDFQIAYLRTLDEAVTAIRALEAKDKVRFETMMSLNFTNPFPWLMDRQAPLHLTVGADPFRTVPAMDAETKATVAAVDIALLPTCPLTIANAKLLEVFASGLADHRRIKLTDCYDAFVNPKLALARP